METLALNENILMRARDISETASQIFKHDVHPKTVSKLIPPLQEDYSNIVKIPLTPAESNYHQCRYMYAWLTSGNLTAAQLGLQTANT